MANAQYKGEKFVAEVLYKLLDKKGVQFGYKPIDDFINEYFKPGAVKNILYAAKKLNYNPYSKELQDIAYSYMKKEKKQEIAKYLASKPQGLFSRVARVLRSGAEPQQKQEGGLERSIESEDLQEIMQEIARRGKREIPYGHYGAGRELEWWRNAALNLYEEYEKLKKEVNKKLAQRYKGVFGFLRKQPYEITRVGKIVSSYKHMLAERFAEIYKRLEEIEQKYSGKGLGVLARREAAAEFKRARRDIKPSLIEIIKYNPATATATAFLILGVFLLAFSSANITGFVIAGKKISATYPVAAGFLLLILALVLSLTRKRKPEKKKDKGKKSKTKLRKKGTTKTSRKEYFG